MDVTPPESEVKFDNIVGSLVEVKYIWPNVSVAAGLVEVFLNHVEELGALGESSHLLAKEGPYNFGSAISYHTYIIPIK